MAEMLKAALGAMTKEKQRLEYFVSTSKAVFARQSGVLEMACDNWGLIYKRQLFSRFRFRCKAQRRRHQVYGSHIHGAPREALLPHAAAAHVLQPHEHLPL